MAAEDHNLMVELAKIFDEDHDIANTAVGAAPALQPTPTPQHASAAPAAGKGSPEALSDPFLLPGDEQTWELDDWSWDPYNLSAVPKDAQHHASACCQALKRRKLPAEVMPALDSRSTTSATSTATPQNLMHHANLHAQPHAAHHTSSAGVHPQVQQPMAGCSTAAGMSSCCSFQMPSAHMPSMPGAAAGLSAFPGAHPGPWPIPMFTGMPWDMTASLQSLMQRPTGMESAAAAAAAAALGVNHAAHAAAFPHTPAAAMLAASASRQDLSQLAPANMLLPSPGAAPAAATPHQHLALPAPDNTASQSGSWSQHKLSVSGSAAGVVPGAALNAHLPHKPAGRAGKPPPPVITTRIIKPAAATGGTTTTPSTVDSDAQSDSDNEGGPNAHGMSGGGGRKTPALPVATYTGSMDDVVTLSDHPADEATRMTCQVAGCGKDLSSLKDYHLRYRICEVHIKLPQVLKDGRLQRFCQQCGRFHDLAAFDAGRKSCREQLSKHNARRRRRAQIESQKAKAVEQLQSNAALASALNGTMLAAAGGAGDGSGGGAGAGMNLGAGGGSGGDLSQDVSRLLSALMQNPVQLNALRLLLGVQPHPALPPMAPFSPDQLSPLVSTDGSVAPAAAPAGPATYGLARDVVDGKGAWAPSFNSDDRALRISMKLFNRTPADLPPDLKEQVNSWLGSMPTAVSGAIRPGCVFLTMHLLLDTHTYTDALKRGLASFLDHLRNNTGCALWHEGAYAVQLAGEMAMLAGGKVTAYYHDPSSPAPRKLVKLEAITSAEQGGCGSAKAAKHYPAITSVQPLCVELPKQAAQDAKEAAGRQVVTVSVEGQGLDAPGIELVVRQGGLQLKVPLHRVAGSNTSYTADIPVHDPSTLPVGRARPTGLVNGLAWLEVARGAWLSPARPLLVLDDPMLVQEVEQLQQPCCRAALPAEELEMLLVDLGMVLAHVMGLQDGFDGATHQTVALKARRLLLFACDMGWAGIAAHVLPLATANCGCASEVVAAVHASSALPNSAKESPEYGSLLEDGAGENKARGLSLLHRVVRSGNLSLLQGVLHWGAVTGYAWRADRNGPGGVTPLHLAALQEDPRLLLALLDYAPASAFISLQAQDGTTPFHLAFQMGHFTLDTLTMLLVKEHLLPKPGKHAAATAGKAACSTAPAAPEVLPVSKGGDLQEVDPCSKCHCKLPPILLSIAAACASCGERVPCLGKLPSSCCATKSGKTAAVPGHDTSHCAGCVTERLHTHTSCDSAHAAAKPGLVGRKRLLCELSRPVSLDAPGCQDDNSMQWAAECANNGVGVQQKAAETAVKDLCRHRHGSVFSITALCQGCFSDRSLEVM